MEKYTLLLVKENFTLSEKKEEDFHPFLSIVAWLLR